MFVNNTGSSTRGGLAVAIPGEMACLASAHDQYGRLPWQQLIDMIVDLIENKVLITNTQASSFSNDSFFSLSAIGRPNRIGILLKDRAVIGTCCLSI